MIPIEKGATWFDVGFGKNYLGYCMFNNLFPQGDKF